MDGIIFDVDGTLWDSTDSVAESWNLAIRENSSLDLTIDGEILQGLFGKTMTEIADALFPSLSEEERRQLDAYMSAHEMDAYGHALRYFMCKELAHFERKISDIPCVLKENMV